MLISLSEIYKAAGDLYAEGHENLEDVIADLGNVARRLTEAQTNITGMISQIKRACADQERGIEMITGSVEDIQSSASINLDATKMMDQSVVRLFEQIRTVREEMSAFKI